MSVIKGKNREEIIKTLKKLGEVVVIAKAEVIYAFKKPYFPSQTIEEVMEEIKKNPKDYRYYQVGDIKITEISEAKNEEEFGNESKFDLVKEINKLKGQVNEQDEQVELNLNNMLRLKKVLRDYICPALISALTTLGLDKQCLTIEEGKEKLDSPKKTEKKEEIPLELKSLYYNHHYGQYIKASGGEKIIIEPELMERIMSHKSVPMDKSKYKTEKKEYKRKYLEGTIYDAITDFWEVYNLEEENGRLGLAQECVKALNDFVFNNKEAEVSWGEKTEKKECPSCNGILKYEKDGKWFVCVDCKECFAETDYRLKASEGEKVHKCKDCDLVAYNQKDKNVMVCLHESFRPEAPFITKSFICPKDLIVCRMGTGSMKDQKEFEEKGKWVDKKKKD